MNRPGKNTLLMVALLLAAAVAYFDDPVLSDPQRGSETTPVPTASPTPTSTPPEISATSTPPTATSTAGINSPPTVQVMTFGGIGQARPFPDDKVYKVNISGSRVSIKLRGQDEDGNLDYLAIVDEDDEILGQADCDAAMGSKCTLEVTIPSPAEYDRAFTYHGIAVDSEGAVSEKSAEMEVTSVWDKGSSAVSSSPRPRPPSPPTPTPGPPTPPPTPVPPRESMTVPAGDQAVVEHESGAKIEIPADATNQVPSGWSAGPELVGVTETTSDEMVTISITDFEAPSPSVVEVQSAFDISILDEDGEDVVLREPVTVTLPLTMPEGKNAADVEVVHWNEHLERWELVEGSVVNEADQTVTVEMDHLSGVGVTFFVEPLKFLAKLAASAMYALQSSYQDSYDDGYKHALTLRGETFIPIKYGGVKIGASLVLDVDDILSLGDSKTKYTVEGEEGFFTYGVNGHLAVVQSENHSVSIRIDRLRTGRRVDVPPSNPAYEYNNDLNFDDALTGISLALSGDRLEADYWTINENGNISPIKLQLNECPICGLEFETSYDSLDAQFLSFTLNIAEGEYSTYIEDTASDQTESESSTEFKDIVSDLADDECGQSTCQVSAAELIDLLMEFIIERKLPAVYSDGEENEELYDYTNYEHKEPEDKAGIGWGYGNGIEDYVGGGHDVNGDGRGDLVFPSDARDGSPLQVRTTGDKFEQKQHYIEVLSVTEGWGIEFDATSTHPDLNAEENDPSEGALIRVDFVAQSLSLNEIHWLVTATTTSPASGQITFRLTNDRSLPFLEDEQLDQLTITVWKDRQLSDLTVDAQVGPAPVRTEEPVTYTVTVENKGPDQADDVMLTMKSMRSLGLSLQRADLSGSSLSCAELDSLGDLACELADIDAEETATATLEFTLKPDFPTGTPVTAAFAVTSDVVRGAPLPKDELTPGDNSTYTTALTASDRNALVALYNATDGGNWTVSTNWLSEEPVSTWFGVRTDALGRVTELNLAGLGLTGEIPAEIGDLTKLRWLNLARNSGLTGELPAEMAQLTELEGLGLGQNNHTGPIPSWVGDLTKLRQLSLGHNRLSGPIPISLNGLTRLEVLYLGMNELTGVIPGWLGDLTNLTRLFLHSNQLSGRVPGSLLNLQNLEYLHLSGNSLTGCLPPGLSALLENDLDQLSLMDCGESAARDPANDFDTLVTLNRAPIGIWSDGTTMWMSDGFNAKLYAYSLATKERDSSKDFDTLVAAGNRTPLGIWSDGTTMWVVDISDEKLYAYSLATKDRDSSKDFNTLVAAGNRDPLGIWSDGTTMWVSDRIDDKLYAYSLATKERDSSNDFDTLVAAGNGFPGGIWSDGTTMWVLDRIDDKLYAYSLATKERDSSKDFNTLVAAGNRDPLGIWSDGTTMWVSDRIDDKLYAYSLATKERDSSKDFDTLVTGNRSPFGIWSDGTTMWVSDSDDEKLYAYSLATKEWGFSKDFDTLVTAGNELPTGIWSDGTTMWVADGDDEKLYAYSLATKDRDSSKDFDTLVTAGNEYPSGIWSDGTTMWVTDGDDEKLYAYSLATKDRDSSKDFDTLVTAGNEYPLGIWSDGTTMWVTDGDDGKLYAYSLATKEWDSSKDFDTLVTAGNEYPLGIWSDGTTMWVTDNRDAKLYAYILPY